MPADFLDVRDTATLSKDAVESWMNEMPGSLKRQSDLVNFIAGTTRAQPHLFPATSQDAEEPIYPEEVLMVDHGCNAPKTALEDAQVVQAAMASPIPFPKAKPAIYDLLCGNIDPDGMLVSKDFKSIRFVGYEVTLSKETTTYEELAAEANGHCEKHFPPSLYALGSFSVTPKMLKWANQSRVLRKNTKIICPDPRTVPAESR